tara:strand:+ start:412 stop:2361 length:1950 start_codon:yes stop_codon:yes gene_type:complete
MRSSLFTATVAAILASAAIAQIPLPPVSALYNGFSRGFNFTASTGFIITQLDLPPNAFQAGDTASYMIRLNGTEVLRSVGNAGPITTSIPVAPGDVVDVLGNWSPAITGATSAHNSYGAGGGTFATTILGVSHTLYRTGWSIDIGDPGYAAGSYTAPTTGNMGLVNVWVTPPSGTFADFTADPSVVGPGETVTFTDTTFTSDPGGIIAWNWDLDGDGVFGDSTLQNPTWIYTACGPHDVSLTVTDASAVSDTVTKTAIVSVAAPTASFTYTTLVPTAPILVQFNSTSTATGPTAIYDWDLDGDGVFETLNGGPSPVGVFASAGLYPNIGLTVTNGCGSDTTTLSVDTRLGLCTTFQGGNGLTATGDGAGNMFDLTVLNPAGLTITGLAGNLDSTASPSVTVEVYVTPTTYVGVETTAAVWTKVATGVGIGAGAGNETQFAINGFCLAPGSYGVLVYYVSSAGGLDYTTGAFSYGNADMSIQTGNGMGALLTGSNNSPRTWNGCLFYDVGMQTGTYTFAGSGGCPASTGVIGNAMTGGVMPTLGLPFSVTMTNAPANEPVAFFAMGVNDLGGVPLTSVGMTGCLLWAEPTILSTASTDATGTGSTVPFVMPNNPLLFGQSIWTQPFVRDVGTNPFNAVLGDAYQATIGCQ